MMRVSKKKRDNDKRIEEDVSYEKLRVNMKDCQNEYNKYQKLKKRIEEIKRDRKYN